MSGWNGTGRNLANEKADIGDAIEQVAMADRVRAINSVGEDGDRVATCGERGLVRRALDPVGTTSHDYSVLIGQVSGQITRGSKVRFLRDGTIIWKGAITSLKRFKDDAREVREGFECGIGLSDFQDLKPGDIIETFEEREIARV